MKEIVNELGNVQGRYMSTATRIAEDNQEIQKMQQQDYQRVADYLKEAEKTSAKFWVCLQPDHAEICGNSCSGNGKGLSIQPGKCTDVLDANRQDYGRT